MKEIIRTNDPVTLATAEAILRGAGIAPLILDTHMSVLDGSLGILPRRLMVIDEHETPARRLLTEAGLGSELRE